MAKAANKTNITSKIKRRYQLTQLPLIDISVEAVIRANKGVNGARYMERLVAEYDKMKIAIQNQKSSRAPSQLDLGCVILCFIKDTRPTMNMIYQGKVYSRIPLT